MKRLRYLGDYPHLGETTECQTLAADMDRTYSQPWRNAGYPQSGALFEAHKAGLQRVRDCNLRSQGLPSSPLPPLGTEETAAASRGQTPPPADTNLAPSSNKKLLIAGVALGGASILVAGLYLTGIIRI